MTTYYVKPAESPLPTRTWYVLGALLRHTRTRDSAVARRTNLAQTWNSTPMAHSRCGVLPQKWGRDSSP